MINNELLNIEEQTKLAQHEAVIERGIGTFVEVGTALLAIRDGKLYRAEFATFEAYCRERWGLRAGSANEMIRAAKVVKNLEDVSSILPEGIRQSRPLMPLDPDTQREVWQRAVETAPDGKVTAAHVQRTVRLHEELNDAPPIVHEVVDKYGIDEPETVRILKRLHKSNGKPGSNGTFDAIVTSGWIQPGDEYEAVQVIDDPALINAALGIISQAHKQLAVSTKPDYDGNEWYTPVEYVDLVRQVLGTVDLDPASCDYAQERVQATRYFTKSDDGLKQDWPGRVFLNPPYSYPDVQQFTDKLIVQYDQDITQEAILLVNNCTDAAWFQRLLVRFPVCFTAGRISFERPDAEQFATRQGQAFFYLGNNINRFAEIFNTIGQVVIAI